MFVKIRYRSQVAGALYYNERKVKEDNAECILAENFTIELSHMTVQDKLARFHQRSILNERAICKALHITIGFHEEEKISTTMMSDVSRAYMNRIGFEDQPYLVYNHKDVRYPHLHIVSGTIAADGTKIELRDLFFWKSTLIVRDLCREMGLRTFNPPKEAQRAEFEVTRALKIEYGKVFTQRAISDVLNTVIPHYNYTTYEELNAVLREYNVELNRGTTDSRLNRFQGILYHVLDENGQRRGAPIRASRFFLKPTHKNLVKKFAQNENLRERYLERMTNNISLAISGGPTWAHFIDKLETKGFGVVADKEKGSIFFIDFRDKAVCSGLSLGPEFSLRSLQDRCAADEKQTQELHQRQHIRLSVC